MRKISIIAFIGTIMFTVVSCSDSGKSTGTEIDSGVADNNKTASNPGAQNPEPAFEFDAMEWDFGKINEGEEVKHTYRFKNVGNEDLVIRNCRATCGCTIPYWEKKPIAPGESSEIEVKFNSTNKPGNQIKNVTITANTNPPETILTFKAQVLPNE